MGDLPMGPLSMHQPWPISVEQNRSCPSHDDYLLAASFGNDVTHPYCVVATEIPNTTPLPS
jgi:hypothetical protein